MKRELNVSQDLVERLFARLDDLIDIHLTFLQSLVRAQQCSTDKSIEAFGPLLLQQVRVVSSFCSHTLTMRTITAAAVVTCKFSNNSVSRPISIVVDTKNRHLS